MGLSGIKIMPQSSPYAGADGATQQSLLDLALEVRNLAADTRERAVGRADALCGAAPSKDTSEGEYGGSLDTGVFEEIRAALKSIRNEVVEIRQQIDRIVP